MDDLIENKDDTTRDKLIRSTAAVIVRNGIGGATLRAVGSHAKVNHGLIKYYFGSIKNLIDETIDRYTTSIIVCRENEIKILKQKYYPSPIPIRQLIISYIAINFDGTVDKNDLLVYFRLYGSTFSHNQGDLKDLISRKLLGLRSMYIDCFCSSLHHIDRREIIWRYSFMFPAMISVSAGHDFPEVAKSSVFDTKSAPEVIEYFATAFEGLFMAPPAIFGDDIPQRLASLPKNEPTFLT